MQFGSMTPPPHPAVHEAYTHVYIVYMYTHICCISRQPPPRGPGPCGNNFDAKSPGRQLPDPSVLKQVSLSPRQQENPGDVDRSILNTIRMRMASDVEGGDFGAFEASHYLPEFELRRVSERSKRGGSKASTQEDSAEDEEEDEDDQDGAGGTGDEKSNWMSETKVNAAVRRFDKMTAKLKEQMQNVADSMLVAVQTVDASPELAERFRSERTVVVRRHSWLAAVLGQDSQVLRNMIDGATPPESSPQGAWSTPILGSGFPL